MANVPIVIALAGLTLYTVLGGADFGAGAWLLAAGRGEHSEKVRDHAHRATAPVWEANHVWLIFVLVILWTAYPRAFAAIASTLSAALFLGALGIILRGAAYALRTGTRTARERRMIDTVSALSSVLVPFTFGAAVGGIASGRVPPGNAQGDLISSWLNPTSITVGLLAVAAAAYTGAVYLAADAHRLGERDLVAWFRLRALAAGTVAGAIAVVGLLVVHSDAKRLWDGLSSGAGLVVMIISILVGAAAMGLVLLRRFEPARYAASATVAGVVAAWAVAQQPQFLPGLTIRQAAASHDVLVLVLVATGVGAVILLPSLALLFRMTLGGTFEREEAEPARDAGRDADGGATAEPPMSGAALRGAAAALLAAVGLLTVADAGWAHAVGVVAAFAFIALGVRALLPGALTG
jgi:cytochrome bd ubiquinol oxidase subunit II